MPNRITPPKIIQIFGTASGKIFKEFCDFSPEDLSMNLMDFLRFHQTPMASSCDGVGICKKCLVSIEEHDNKKEFLSCLITLKQIFRQFDTPVVINISYL